MTKTEQLFSLIHSLSVAEKRYFRRFCQLSGGRDRNYLKVFDILAAQKTCDEAALRGKLGAAKFAKQLHVTKNYLRKLILRALRNFHAQSSPAREVTDMLANVAILYDRELFAQCDAELKRAVRLAEMHELDYEFVAIRDWQRKLVQARRPTEFRELQGIIDAQAEATDRLTRVLRYWQLNADLSLSFRNPDAGDIRNLDLLARDEGLDTVQLNVLHYHAKYYQYVRERNHPKAREAMETLIRTLESDEARIQRDPAYYISSINNYISFLVFDRDYETALSYAGRITGANWELAGRDRVLMKQLSRTYNIALEIYRDSALPVAPQMLADVKRFLRGEQQRVPEEYQVSLWFQLASLYFRMGDYSESLRWLNVLIESKTELLRPDLHRHARMLNLVVHTELKHFVALGYYVESTRRYLRKAQDELETYQIVLFNFFRELTRIPEADFGGAYARVYARLFPPGKNPKVSADVRDYFDWGKWILQHCD